MSNIIVQDADADILEILTLVLRGDGHTVMPLSGYDNIIEKAGRFRPDLFLLDFVISGENAIACCRIIKEKFSLPVIALSCNTKLKEVYTSLGFDDYLLKPFDLESLDSMVTKHLHKNTR